MTDNDDGKLNNIINSVTTLYEKCKSDNELMNVFDRFITTEMPRLIEKSLENKINEEKELEMCKGFINQFTNSATYFPNDDNHTGFIPKESYFYIENNDVFISYDNINYSLTSEDKIINSFYKTLSIWDECLDDENKHMAVFCRKYKKKMGEGVIQKIKTDKNLFNTIPESITIQNVINFFTPLIFETKTETKYFLTILGDNILNKNSNSIFFSPLKSKEFNNNLSSIIKHYCPNLNVMNNFKYQYNKSHGYNNTRILYFTNLVSNNNYWSSFIKSNVFNIIAIACHYSNIYRNSDNYILDQDKSISDKILYFLNKDENKILDIFLHEMIQEDTMCTLSSSNNKISTQEMLYLWKMFTNRKQIPKVITKNRLIELLKGVYEFNNGFLKVSSNYLDYNREFISFFDKNFTSGDDEFEISEINLLYKNWLKIVNKDNYLIDETKMKNIILHFYKNYNLESDSKNILNISSPLWNKKEHILESIKYYKREFMLLDEDINILTLYKKYCVYIQKEKSDTDQFIVSKQYFEKFIKRHIRSGMQTRLGEFIMKGYWKNLR